LRPGIAGSGAGQAAALESGADRGLASPDLPRPACLACVSPDHLPGHLSRRESCLTRKLTAKLRTGRPLRKRRRKSTERATRFVAPGCLIDERPLIVDERSRVGDWEGDSIVGRASRSALGTLVDRRTRCLGSSGCPPGTARSRRCRGCGSRRATAGGEDDIDLDQGRRWPATTCWPGCG